MSKTNKSTAGWRNAVPGILFALLGLLVLTGLVLIFGRVSGEEFSPQAFQRRRFSYFRIPIIHVPISGTTRKSSSSSLDDLIAIAIKAPSAISSKNRWEIVTMESSTSPAVYEGDAKILCDFLDLKNHDGNLHYEEWANEHPKVAAVVWPVVADVARKGQYVMIPEIFELAEHCTKPSEFDDKISTYMESEATAIGDDYRSVGEYRQAVFAYRLALNYADSTDAQSGLDASLAELPEPPEEPELDEPAANPTAKVTDKATAAAEAKVKELEAENASDESDDSADNSKNVSNNNSADDAAENTPSQVDSTDNDT